MIKHPNLSICDRLELPAATYSACDRFFESWLHLEGAGKKYKVSADKKIGAAGDPQPATIQALFLNVIKVLSYLLLLPLTCFGLYRRCQVRKGLQTGETSEIKSGDSPVQHVLSQHKTQLGKFEEWARKGQWSQFATAHYDWWMFPVDYTTAGQGSRYAINDVELKTLKENKQFMAGYKRGIELVLLSWGWDIEADKPLDTPLSNQKWTGYGVRLGKIAYSLRLFDEVELHRKLKKFHHHIKDKNSLERWVHKACCETGRPTRPVGK